MRQMKAMQITRVLMIIMHWRPTEARSLSKPVAFPNGSSAWDRNEVKDFVMLSAL